MKNAKLRLLGGKKKENSIFSPSVFVGELSLDKRQQQTPDNDFRGKIMRGFTLIELLVVVLIIGILAAVALPQYQKAVMKSRMAEVQIVTDSLEKGLSLWVLNNGVPSVSETHIPFEELDITLPLICEANQKCYTSPSKWQVAGGSEALLLHALFVTNGIATVSITVPNTATFGTPTISFSYDLSNSLVSKSCTYSSSDNASKVTCETLKSLDNRWNVIRASGRTPPPQS